MDEIKELYQQMILDHNKEPRNYGKLNNATNIAQGHNPLCGDKIDIYLVIDDGKIQDVKFYGSGCAISKASSSIMTTILKGKTIDEAKGLFEKFHNVVTSDTESEIDVIDLGKLAVFYGVREFPARIKCASLPWHTMMDALEKNESTTSTE